MSQHAVARYFSLVKFSHTVFAMPFAMIGYFLGVKYAGVGFEWRILLLVLLCMVFARNAAMGFNRYADRYIDARNPRTDKREIPAGIIQPKAALAFVIVNAIAFMVTCWFINRLVFYLSPIALLVVLGYSLTKKYTALCHFILGLGLSLAPIGAYLSVTGHFAWLSVMFSCIVLLWTGGFDIIYALQDEQFDVQEKLYSIPAMVGIKKALHISSLAHFICGIIVLSVSFGWNFGLYYNIGAGIFLFLLLYQHLIVKPNDLSRVNAAFATSNGIASVVFAIFVILDMYL